MKRVPFFPLFSLVLAGAVCFLALNVSEKNDVIKNKDARILELEEALDLAAKNMQKTKSHSRNRFLPPAEPEAQSIPDDTNFENPPEGKHFTQKQIEDRLNLLNFLRDNMPKVLSDIQQNDARQIEKWTQKFSLSDEQISRLRDQSARFQEILRDSWEVVEPQLAAARDLTAEEAQREEEIFKKIKENSLDAFLPSILTEEQGALLK